MRRVVLLAIIGSLSAPCAVAEAGVLAASVPGTDNSSTLYKLDSTDGKVRGSIVLPFILADDFSFSKEGLSIWVVDTSHSYVNHIDLAGSLLSQYFVDAEATCLTVLSDDRIAVGGPDGIRILDPSTGAVHFFALQLDVSGLASDGVDRIFAVDTYGTINTYDLSGNLYNSLWTQGAGETTSLAYTGTNFLIASAGGTIQEVDSVTGDLINSFAGPRGFTGGIDFVPDGQFPPSPVPEPTSVIMMMIGAGFTLVWRRRKL